MAGPLVPSDVHHLVTRVRLSGEGDTVSVVYIPAATFRRTAAERVDQVLAWNRTDKAFFAAGACHILAWTFIEQHPTFHIAALRQAGEEYASHVIATDGTWAFDHDGWTLESELLAVTAAYEPEKPWESLTITEDLATYCKSHNHRLPEFFAEDPRPRARAYIATFPPMPPATTAPPDPA